MVNPLSLLTLLLSFTIFFAKASPIYCSGNNYGSPTVSKCFSTIISIVADSSFRFFVEQPLRTSPQTDWLPFIDSRPASERVPVAQLPKWWSEDNCNAALVSYGPVQQQNGVTLTSWSNVYNMATQIAKNCLIDNQNGGAGILYNPDHKPAMTLYIWADGAPFDNVMTTYMSSDYPKGLDPTNLPRVLSSNTSSAAELTTVNAPTLVGDMVLGGGK